MQRSVSCFSNSIAFVKTTGKLSIAISYVFIIRTVSTCGRLKKMHAGKGTEGIMEASMQCQATADKAFQ